MYTEEDVPLPMSGHVYEIPGDQSDIQTDNAEEPRGVLEEEHCPSPGNHGNNTTGMFGQKSGPYDKVA